MMMMHGGAVKSEKSAIWKTERLKSTLLKKFILNGVAMLSCKEEMFKKKWFNLTFCTIFFNFRSLCEYAAADEI